MQISKYDFNSASIVAHTTFLNREVDSFSGAQSSTVATLGTPTGATNPFYGCLSTPDGGALLVPYTNGYFGRVTSAGVYSETAAISNSARFRGGCIVSDKLAVLSPTLNNYIGLYNLEDDTYLDGPELEDSFASGKGYSGAAYSKYGKVVFAPRTNDYIAVYDPETNEVTNFAHGLGDSSTELFGDACPLPDGTVLLIPYSIGQFYIFDPDKLTLTAGPSYSGTANFQSAQGLPNGDVLCVPYSSDYIVIYRFKSGDIYKKQNVTIDTDTAFIGSCIAKDGRVFFAPRSNANIGIYNPYDDTYEEGDALTGCAGACQIADGTIVMPGYTVQAVYGVTATDAGGSDTALVANRYFNSSI